MKQKRLLEPIETELSKYYYSLPKDERKVIDKKYRKFIYAENCTFADERECEVWHHLHENWAGAGKSIKADDIWTIPMLNAYHVPVIEKGYNYADEVLGVDTMEVITKKIIQLHEDFMWVIL
jgi:hypothetical protein